MPESLFRGLVLAVAVLFAGVFAVVVVPPLLVQPDVMAAALAGFVNPFAAGYAPMRFCAGCCWPSGSFTSAGRWAFGMAGCVWSWVLCPA